MGGLTGQSFRRGVKVKVGNDVPRVCERGGIDIRHVGFQWVTREQVSGTYCSDPLHLRPALSLDNLIPANHRDLVAYPVARAARKADVAEVP